MIVHVDLRTIRSPKKPSFLFAAQKRENFHSRGCFISSAPPPLYLHLYMMCRILRTFYFFSIRIYRIIRIINQRNTEERHSSQIDDFWMFEERMTVVRFPSLICFKNLSLGCEMQRCQKNVALQLNQCNYNYKFINDLYY
jgi:hypothetical protein